jgi:hypothetical protein
MAKIGRPELNVVKLRRFGRFQSVARSGQNSIAQGLPWETLLPEFALKGPLGRREPAPRPDRVHVPCLWPLQGKNHLF